MIRKTIVFLLLCVSASAAWSAETSADRANSLYAGARSLQFGVVGDLFNLDFRSFEGNTISGKWQTSDRSAIRFGATIDVDVRNRDQQRFVDDSLTSDATIETQDMLLYVNLQKLWYLGEPRHIAPYFGLGPVLSYSRLKNTSDDATSGNNQESIRKRYGGGLSFLLGVEWFPIKDVSLLLEYRTDAQYFKEKTDITQTSGSGSTRADKLDTDSFEVNASAVQLGLSVYF